MYVMESIEFNELSYKLNDKNIRHAIIKLLPPTNNVSILYANIHIDATLKDISDVKVYHNTSHDDYVLRILILPITKATMVNLILQEDNIVNELQKQLNSTSSTYGTAIEWKWKGNNIITSTDNFNVLNSYIGLYG